MCPAISCIYSALTFFYSRIDSTYERANFFYVQKYVYARISILVIQSISKVYY